MPRYVKQFDWCITHKSNKETKMSTHLALLYMIFDHLSLLHSHFPSLLSTISHMVTL
jgi:hypothetical protein